MGIEKAGVELTAIDSATRVFNQVGAAAKGLEKNFNSLAAAGGTLGVGFAIERIASATSDWEKANIRLNVTLRATAGSLGLTRGELDDLAETLSQSTIFNEKELRNAEANLIKFGKIHGDVFVEALKISADYASFTGSDLMSATQSIGRAIVDPLLGFRGLSKEVGTLTAIEKDYIAQLEAQGRMEEVHAFAINKLKAAFGGLSQEMNTGVTKSIADTGKAWDSLLESFGRSDVFQGAARRLDTLLVFMRNRIEDTQKEGMRWLPGGASSHHGATGEWADTAAVAAADEKERTDAITAAHLKAIPILKQWNAQLSETTKEETALTLIREGEARLWPEEDQRTLKRIARLMDYRKAMLTVTEAESHGIKLASDAVSHADEIQENYLRGARDRQESLEFEVGLLGRTTQQQERLNAVHEIELRQREALRALANTDLDPRELQRRQESIIAASQRETQVVLSGLQKRRDAERSWATGTKTAFNEYIEHATNAAEQAAFVFTNAFHSMEDALVDWARTGKMNSAALRDAIISDIIRVGARQAIAFGASKTGGFFASLFGGGGSSSSFLETHTGGVIGETAKYRHDVDPAVFAGARRMHFGGLAGDEVPAILQRGETVIPRGARMGGIVQHFHIGGNVTHADLAAVAQAGRDSAIAFVAESRRRSPTGPFG